MAMAKKIDSALIYSYLVNCRFYIYQRHGDNKWNLYENMYEEGEHVKKRIGVFEKKEEAQQTLDNAKAAFRDELLQFVTITDKVEEVKDARSSSGHRDDGPGSTTS